MPDTYYDSALTDEQIEAALEAIDGVVTQENNGKVLAVENGKIVAKSASAWTDTPVLEPLSVTANGDYTPGEGVDGYNSVHVAVPGGGGGTIEPLSVTENGTYNPPSGVDGYAPVTVNVQGGFGPVLPEGYTRVPYIESSGEQYIDTGFGDSNGVVLVGRMCFMSTTASDSCLCGVWEQNKRHSPIVRFTSTNHYAESYGAVFREITNFPIQYNSLSDYIISTRGCYAFICNAGSNADGSSASLSSLNLWLFAMNNNSTNPGFSDARIDQLLIYDHNLTLARAFYAVQRDSDGELGLFDTITNHFFVNQGSGSFTTET